MSNLMLFEMMLKLMMTMNLNLSMVSMNFPRIYMLVNPMNLSIVTVMKQKKELKTKEETIW